MLSIPQQWPYHRLDMARLALLLLWCPLSGIITAQLGLFPAVQLLIVLGVGGQTMKARIVNTYMSLAAVRFLSFTIGFPPMVEK